MTRDFFVGVYEPVDVRRNLLESSKEIIKSLQTSEKLNSLREKKVRLYKKMRKTMDEIDVLVEKLKEQLPKSKFDSTEKGKGGRKIKTQLTTELEKLDKQLQKVEKELSSLK